MESVTVRSREERRPRSRLPLELLIQIIECVPPNRQAILPVGSVATKTLVSLTRVSRSIYRPATTVLRQQCMYVDTSRRLADVLLCMDRLVPSLSPGLSLRHVTALYLAPFGASLDDQPTARWVREMLCEVSETLLRLTISMPFSSLEPWDDHLNVRRTLREGLEQLHALEEFACIGDYPTLSVSTPAGEATGTTTTDVWRLWPRLRRLMLFGVPLESHWLWWDIATLESLTHVVLVRPRQTERAVDLKHRYFRTLPAGDERLQKKLRVVLMHRVRGDEDAGGEDGRWLPQGHPDYLRLDESSWEELDADGRMEVTCYGVPRMGVMSSEELLVRLAKSWVETGTLWDARA
ncbi:hypothetical protein NLU13_2306 [Sarocladium strictum]|uniref:Uncharacterized protein n=1 Tax=Sarocladium strictum TaxID=5046 RepID=A0AA39GSU4_SARSR|nr:hypothetical protein NLU13_2306 [Sarocladium strictum]